MKLSDDWAVVVCLLLSLVFCGESAAQTCKKFEGATVTGNLQQAALKESSGLAVSRKNPGVFWSHNDSGGKPRIFAFDAKGNGLGTFVLQGASHVDWEDMAAGPCPDGSPCLYVADVGDNQLRRREVVVYRFKEPKADQTTAGKETTVTDVDVFTLRYPDSAHNCEVLLVHPTTRDLLLVTKTLNSTSRIYGLSGKKLPGTHVLESKGTLTTSEPLLTGGDWSPSGTQVVLRGYSTAFVYTTAGKAVPEDKDLTQGFVLPKTRQGEAITFSLDGKSLWTTTEKLPAPIHKLSCVDWVPPPEPTKEARPEPGQTDASERGREQTAVEVSPPPPSCNCDLRAEPPLGAGLLLLLWWLGVRFRRRKVL